jgi:hypothetical protein
MANNYIENERIIRRYPLFWVDRSGRAFGGFEHLDIAREILRAGPGITMGEAYRKLFNMGFIRVIKEGVWIEYEGSMTHAQKEWVRDLEVFKDQEAAYDVRRSFARTNESLDFDDRWAEMFTEMSLAPAVKAVPSSGQSTPKPNTVTKPGGSKFDEAVKRASSVAGDSPDDEEEMFAYFQEMGIDPTSEQARNLGRSLGNVASRLAGNQ